jgi:cell division protein FtsA
MSGVKVAAVTGGIAGEHVSARGSSGVVAVNGDEITAGDVARVNEVARAVSLGPDQELLHVIRRSTWSISSAGSRIRWG